MDCAGKRSMTKPRNEAKIVPTRKSIDVSYLFIRDFEQKNFEILQLF